jgi:flagellin-like hook-associated protein FlgL
MVNLNMGRIGATLGGFERTLIHELDKAEAEARLSSLRLATQSRITAPKDTPSDFLALSQYRTRLRVVQSALGNVAAASGFVSQVELALDQIRTQINTIRELALDDVDQSLSPSQRASHQGEIDAALREIDGLANSQIDGRRPLNGSAGFSVSGVDRDQIREVHVLSTAGPGTIVPAKHAELAYTGSAGLTTAAATITIEGNEGGTTLAIADNQPLQEIVRRINDRAATTGVVARREGDQLIFASAEANDLAKVKVTTNSGTFTVTGGNGAGLAYGQSAQRATQPALSGTVTRSAEQAILEYTGTTGAITSDAAFTIVGDRGSATFNVTGGVTPDDLDDVAAAINEKSHVTGVVAEVSGDTLRFLSVAYGSDADVQIDVTSGTFNVTGGDGNGSAHGTNAEVAINGITLQGNQPAESARLVYSGVAGTIQSDATFVLRGKTGNFTFSVNEADTLTATRNAINLQSATTGITASVDGNDLVLTSDASGAEAFVEVEVTAGEFDVFSEDGLGYATRVSSAPAQLVYTASGTTIEEDIEFTLQGTGSQVINLAAGTSLFDARNIINLETPTTGVVASVDGNRLILTSEANGAAAEISVTVTDGTFEVTGGNGDGTANGVNAETRVEGVDAVTNDDSVEGNKVRFRQGNFRVELELQPGFEGDFNPILITDDALRFALSTDAYRYSYLPLPDVSSQALGGVSGVLSQLYSGGTHGGLGPKAATAVRIADEALSALDEIEGRVAGFSNATIASSSSLLSEIETQLVSSIDDINQVNVDEEQARLSSIQLRIEATRAALETLQINRLGLVSLLRSAAGLSSA